MLSTFVALLLSPCFALRSTPNLGPAKPAAVVCDQVDLELPDIMGKTQHQFKTAICHDPKFATAYSQNCQDQNCDLIKQAKAFEGQLGFSDRGTPAARLCEKLGGESLMIFLSTKAADRQKVHMCNKAQDWVSVDYLLQQRKSKKQ